MNRPFRSSLPPWRSALSLFCAFLILAPQPARAFPSAQPATPQPQDQPLEIIAVQGDQATHLVNYSRQEPVTILARIGGQPVKGVNVRIALPESGPGGYFGESRTRTQNLTTNRNGRASTRGFVPNKELGPYIVRVMAHYNGQTATIDVPQRNEWSQRAEADNRRFRNSLLLAAVPVAAVVILVLVFRDRLYN